MSKCALVVLSCSAITPVALAQGQRKPAAKHYTIAVSGGIPFRDGLWAVVGQDFQLSATLVKNGKKESSGAFEWASTNPAIATVVDGLLEARAYGTTAVVVTETLTGVSQTVPLVVSADQYFWTTSLDELNTLLAENLDTYQYDGVAFEVLETGENTSLQPLWRFLETTTITHFWTTDPTGELFLPPFNAFPGLREGTAGYVYWDPPEGAVPVYRWSDQLTGVHFWSTDPNGESFGLHAVLEGVAFFALPIGSGVEGAVPMYRARCASCQ